MQHLLRYFGVLKWRSGCVDGMKRLGLRISMLAYNDRRNGGGPAAIPEAYHGACLCLKQAELRTCRSRKASGRSWRNRFYRNLAAMPSHAPCTRALCGRCLCSCWIDGATDGCGWVDERKAVGLARLIPTSAGARRVETLLTLEIWCLFATHAQPR
jgi:hypothetical protein